MHPHQKYPSAYKSYSQYPETVPQSPFDVAYGSSLLPRQLLVSSPFVQVASPLPSPGHQFAYRPGPSQGAPTYIMAPPPPPKLSLPPESRKRGFKHSQRLKQQQHQHEDEIDTPLKSKYKSISSSTSSLDESTFDMQNFAQRNTSGTSQEDTVSSHLYANPANQSSSSSLYQLHSGSSQSQTQLNGGTFQLSKLPTRCIILMGVDPELTLTQFIDFITFGPLESARMMENYPEEGTNSLCLTFLKMNTCLNFYNNLLTYLARFKKLINSPQLNISFVHCKKLLPFISHAINNDGATRNVYIGNLNGLDIPITTDFLTNEFSKFGIIDKIDLIQRPRGTVTPTEGETDDAEEKEAEISAFIHFTSIASAIKAVEQLSLNTFWQPCKIFYGTDRCSLQNDTLAKSLTDESPSEEEEELTSQNRFFENGFIREEDEDDIGAVQYFYPQHYSYSEEDIAAAFNQKRQAVRSVQSTAGGTQNIGNRTICLGKLDSKTKVEDICNVVRGGILQSIRHIPAKNICFLTFIDPAAAAQFFANANINPIVLHGRRVKVGWGKHSGQLPNFIALAVTIGASRNLYIGIKEEDLEDPKALLPDEDTLREDFGVFGEIEQVNFFKQNRCVFLNFHNITTAMKVVEDANGDNADEFHKKLGDKYRNFKISFGKDRCGNPPKAKKKKNRKKKNRRELGDSTVGDETGDFENTEIETQNVEVEEVPAELFASMGITSKRDDDDEEKEEETKEEVDEFASSTANAFGITSKTEEPTEGEAKKMNGDVADYCSLSESDSDSDVEIIFTKPQSSFNPKRNVCAPTNNARKPPPQKFNRHKKTQSSGAYTPSVGSRVSSHASLSSMYYPRDPEPVYYKVVPFAPPAFVPTGRQGFTASSPVYHKQMAAPQFSTNGSQVMAQYLAQSQHANMVYAANVLNAGGDYYEDEYADGFRRGGKPKRR